MVSGEVLENSLFSIQYNFMLNTRRPFSKRSANGTARIQRDNYSNSQTDWWAIRKKVCDRDEGVCQSMVSGRKCGAPGKEVHHVTPLSRGGVTAMSNLILLCTNCHDMRHKGHPLRSYR
jgi:5-methylcytosine-specific restriction endonuclease McrA